MYPSQFEPQATALPITSGETAPNEKCVPPLTGPKPTISLVQAPCVLIDQYADNAEDDVMTYFRQHVEQITHSVNGYMAQPRSNALVADGVNTWLSDSPQLSPEDQLLLKTMRPIQEWLRSTLLERDVSTGFFAAPKNAVFRERLEQAAASSRFALDELAELTLQFEAFRVAMPVWLNMMTEAPAEGVEISEPMAIRLETFGVRVTCRQVSAIQWALLLAAALGSLERRWIAASVAQKVAYLSLQRGNFMGMISDKLSEELHFVRQRVEPDEDRLLPLDLQWLDTTKHSRIDAIWS